MKKVLVVLSVVIIFYIFWTKSGRNEIVVNAYKPIEYFLVFKKDSATANIVRIQPFITNLDYQNKNSTVVFSEHIASWLVAANKKKSYLYCNKN